MLTQELQSHGAPAALVEALLQAGIRRLYPPQAQAVRAGLLQGRESLVVASPTASGKTLIAELCALMCFFQGRGKTAYLVPLRALAREKYEELSARYSRLGLRVAYSTGDYDRPEPWLARADLVVATNEKMDSLVRHRARWLQELALVVADEVHLIGEPYRGPTLEVVLTKLRSMNPGLRLLALSATVPNAPEIASWLGARLLRSNWRPVPLREGVYYQDAIFFSDGSTHEVRPLQGQPVLALILDALRAGGQCLVFVNTRRAAEALAKRAGPLLSREYLQEEELRALQGLAQELLRAVSEPTGQCRRLAQCTAQGMAFHHAGLSAEQRRLVEDAFRAGRLKALAATTTLAMGLNLPSRRVVVKDWWRYRPGLGMSPLRAAEVKQMLGRAGRPGLDPFGEGILVARNPRDVRYLMENYLLGEAEPVRSALQEPGLLRMHVLGAVAGLFARTRGELRGFLQGTLCALQQGPERLQALAEEALQFLAAHGMLTARDERIAATVLGRRVSELYIDPLTAVLFVESLQMPKEKTDFALLHMLCRSPDMPTLSLRRRDWQECSELLGAHREALLAPQEELYPDEQVLAELKTASVLMQWVLERPEERICAHFGLGPGDVHALTQQADWLLYAAEELGRILRRPREELQALGRLRARVRYGVKEELLALVSLKGIGRVRARSLFQAGLRSPEDIKKAPLQKLAGLPALGPQLARRLKEALGVIE